MIPKNAFFVWIGRKIPSYVNFSIERFKKVNPDFNINFIYRSIDEINNIYSKKTDIDRLFQKCIDSLLNKTCIYQYTVNHSKNNNFKFIQTLLDVFRLMLINKYGGIYLDCDTYAIKKIDNELLDVNSFVVQRHYNDSVIIKDNYFFGSVKNNSDIIKFTFDKCILQTTKGQTNSIRFLDLKNRFLQCNLHDDKINVKRDDIYIDHYQMQTWKNGTHGIQTPISKYDNHFKYE